MAVSDSNICCVIENYIWCCLPRSTVALVGIVLNFPDMKYSVLDMLITLVIALWDIDCR